MSQDTPKLRMAAAESAETLVRRIEHEERASHQQREIGLEQSLAPFRVGSVSYLNAVPLTRGLEDEVIYTVPSQLAEMLERDELDAALVSIVEALFHQEFDILDEVAIASLGEVQSVLVAHRKPLDQIQELYCDTASLTSVQLARVLLAERGLRPVLKPLKTYRASLLPDYALIIGNPALDFVRAPHEHQIWDLGTAWYELTGLPFVYAVWALRRDKDTTPLRRQLREARSFGLETLDSIIRSRTEYDYEFRKDYLSWHIHFHLGADEKRGIARFVELLRKHCGQKVFEPHFVF